MKTILTTEALLQEIHRAEVELHQFEQQYAQLVSSTLIDNPTEVVAPIYRLHEYAEDLGMTDLAQNLDHYLYGHNRQ
jgi:hypothetical protein